MTELERFPIEALVALVERETLIGRSDLARYGELQCDPVTPASLELNKRFDQVLQGKKGSE